MDKEDDLIASIDTNLESSINLFKKFKEESQTRKKQQARPKISKLVGDNDNELKSEEDIIIKQSDVDRLMLENKKLRARCELLESGNAADVTRRIDDAVDQAHQIETLSHKITEFKQREEKIIETLGSKAVELRKAFCRLTGYTLYAHRDLIYKVKSIHAEGKEDKLEFKVSPHGEIKLLRSKYSDKYTKYVKKYLDEGQDNFPPFLASIQLELFNSMMDKTNNVTTSEDMDITLINKR